MLLSSDHPGRFDCRNPLSLRPAHPQIIQIKHGANGDKFLQGLSRGCFFVVVIEMREAFPEKRPSSGHPLLHSTSE